MRAGGGLDKGGGGGSRSEGSGRWRRCGVGVSVSLWCAEHKRADQVGEIKKRGEKKISLIDLLY